jgi:hypothetical protein
MVEFPQSLQTELADPGGAQLAAGVADLTLNPVNEEAELPRIKLALVGGAIEAPEQLRAIERLAVPIALDHLQRLRDGPLVGGEAMTTLRALAPAPKSGATLGLAGLEDGGGGVAAGTVHFVGV